MDDRDTAHSAVIAHSKLHSTTIGYYESSMIEVESGFSRGLGELLGAGYN